MTEPTYPEYMPYQPKALHNLLVQRNIPTPMATAIKETVAKEKEIIRTERIQRTVHAKMWDELLLPLRDELRNVRASLAYAATKHDSTRREAFAAYETALLRTRANLKTIQAMTDGSPKAAAKEANVANDGCHWTDWVPKERKLRIALLFDAIPYTTRAKRKVPFERVISAQITMRKLKHKRGILNASMEKLERELFMLSDDDKQNRLEIPARLMMKISDFKKRISRIDTLLTKEESSKQ